MGYLYYKGLQEKRKSDIYMKQGEIFIDKTIKKCYSI